MSKINVKRLAFTALFTALCCILTMVGIPSPIGGHINPGDAAVLLSTYMLGPYWGAVAAGIGSLLGDVFLGYIIYAPATMVIKAAMALCAGLIMRGRISAKNTMLGLTLAGACAELIMIAGYFLYQSLVLGLGPGAIAEVPGNCIQGIFGAMAAASLYLALRHSAYLRELTDK